MQISLSIQRNMHHLQIYTYTSIDYRPYVQIRKWQRTVRRDFEINQSQGWYLRL